MTRSFWGFGYSHQPQHAPPKAAAAGSAAGGAAGQPNPKDAMIPPNGTFAPATTAITQGNNPSVAPFSSGGRASAGNSLNSAAVAAAGSAAGGGPAADSTMAMTPSSQGFYATAGNINIPAAAQIQGKLRVRVREAQGLAVRSPASNPYVVVQCSTSEHISRSASTNAQGGAGSGIAIPSSRLNIASSKPGSGRSSASASSIAGGAGAAGTSNRSGAGARPAPATVDPANPQWQDEAIFDVTSYNSDLEITVYDAGDNDRLLGHTRIRPDFKTSRSFDGWHLLEVRADAPPLPPLPQQQHHHHHKEQEQHEHGSGSGSGGGSGGVGRIHVSLRFEHTGQQHFGPSDFQVLRLIGKGTFGQVYQVRKRDSNRVYAMKVLSKRVIVREKEIAHTIGERDILVRTSGEASNFLVGLKFSFQTNTDLYLVTDYMSGGELFWHLQREGRFSEPRAKFYIAELIVALEHLHNNDIVYRDLKPENILLDASGHVALCDFGLSKANLHNGTTNTFCGTTEYLAPEVLLDDKGYTKMVDFWSLGVLIFEMCCGWSPFYAEDNQQMYKNIAFGKVRFPKDALSPEGRDFVKGLLNRNPKHRLGATHDARELMAHPFFRDIDWALLKKKQIPPPYKPHVASEEDTSNFDPEFTSASTSVLTRNMEAGTTPLSPGIQDKFKGFTFVDDTLMDEYFKGKPGSAAQPAPISASFRAPPPKMGRDEGIDLYDENEIKLSHSHYDSGIKHKFANSSVAASGGSGTHGSPAQRHDDDLMRMDEEDEDMMDDDRNGNYDDFVEGQGFEM